MDRCDDGRPDASTVSGATPSEVLLSLSRLPKTVPRRVFEYLGPVFSLDDVLYSLQLLPRECECTMEKYLREGHTARWREEEGQEKQPPKLVMRCEYCQEIILRISCRANLAHKTFYARASALVACARRQNKRKKKRFLPLSRRSSAVVLLTSPPCVQSRDGDGREDGDQVEEEELCHAQERARLAQAILDSAATDADNVRQALTSLDLLHRSSPHGQVGRTFLDAMTHEWSFMASPMLDDLKAFTIRDRSEAESERFERYTQCGICLEPMCEPVRLPCSHILCVDCSTKLVNDGKSACPVCRCPHALSHTTPLPLWGKVVRELYPAFCGGKRKVKPRRSSGKLLRGLFLSKGLLAEAQVALATDRGYHG